MADKLDSARAHGRKSWSGAWRFVLTNPYPPGVLADAWQAGRDEARTERVNCHDPQVSEVAEMRKVRPFQDA